MTNLKAIRKRYAGIATNARPDVNSIEGLNHSIGYSEKEMQIVPEAAKFNLACGNPTAIASLKKGEIILDLGCGAGFDCFLAAVKVGKEGHVTGIDATPEMIEKAIKIATKSGYKNIDFKVGDIEHLPVKNSFVDVAISNCVINLISNKSGVFEEIYRVLKPGGRLMISDLVSTKEFPFIVRKLMDTFSGGTAKIISKDRYIDIVRIAGFDNIKIMEETVFPIDAWLINPNIKQVFKRFAPQCIKELANRVVSIRLYGTKTKK